MAMSLVSKGSKRTVLSGRTWPANLARIAIEKLQRENPEFGDVRHFKVIEGWRSAEIAPRLGLTADVVRQRLHRGRPILVERIAALVKEYAASPEEESEEIGYMLDLLERHFPSK